jgi:Protein of unknown function (DUF3431)
MHADASAHWSVQVVVSRFAEDLSWLDELPFKDVLVYDKGSTPHNAPPHVKVQKLPNVGKCDHTYLYHLHTWYDSLADVTVFLPGSVMSDELKKRKMRSVIAAVQRTGRSAFPAIPCDIALHILCPWFQLGGWKTSDPSNTSSLVDGFMQPCPERPLGRWYAKNFPGISVHNVWLQGIFAVDRTHAMHCSRERYRKLLRYVDNHPNPEAGHYIERCWEAIFHPVDDACMIPLSSFAPGIGLALDAAALGVGIALVTLAALLASKVAGHRGTVV